jgi:F-type H+-transporting ATPase subunit epsilon
MPDLMTLKVLLPFEIHSERKEVSRIVAETREGSYGFLPHRLDCVAALSPGILVFETKAEGEVFLAVDEGVMVKVGLDVMVSVRRAMAGTDLARLRDSVEKDFRKLDTREEAARAAMAKLETGFLRRFARLHGE